MAPKKKGPGHPVDPNGPTTRHPLYDSDVEKAREITGMESEPVKEVVGEVIRKVTPKLSGGNLY